MHRGRCCRTTPPPTHAENGQHRTVLSLADVAASLNEVGATPGGAEEKVNMLLVDDQAREDDRYEVILRELGEKHDKGGLRQRGARAASQNTILL